MPLGDPQGGLFEYTVEGLPESIFAVTIPVKDLDRSVSFYIGTLGFNLLGRNESEAYLRRGQCRIIIKKSGETGIDTGILFAVDSPYNTRRRLIDEEVEFVSEPVRGPLGTYTRFRDPDGNIIGTIEPDAEFRLRANV